jgi:hypothetical protein
VLSDMLLHWLAAAGCQLFNSYGPRSNDDLLLRYSFVAANNPDDVYTLDDLPQRLRSHQVAKDACWACKLAWAHALTCCAHQAAGS